ncbi:hypothetical protein [Streptomyces sp. 7N604]|uniref:hypothetical protein n=1 Tax=Streptomyces sp. 7N604 TaxID=3457415 RepID=UPI003FD34755
MNTTTRHQVRITSDGRLYIDAEPQHVPDGVEPSQVAIHVLHVEAAGRGEPVLAEVQDDRSNSQFDMEVGPDGSTQAPGSTPAPASRQGASYLERLAAAQAAGRAHDFTTAIPAADEILQQLTAELGDTAQETLEVAQFRADLAFLSGDFAYATSSWTWLALAWFDRLGPGKRRTQEAASNAAAAWMRLPPSDAIGLGPDLVNMLLEVAAPERTATMRAQIQMRLQEIIR